MLEYRHIKAITPKQKLPREAPGVRRPLRGQVSCPGGSACARWLGAFGDCRPGLTQSFEVLQKILSFFLSFKTVYLWAITGCYVVSTFRIWGLKCLCYLPPTCIKPQFCPGTVQSAGELRAHAFNFLSSNPRSVARCLAKSKLLKVFIPHFPQW